MDDIEASKKPFRPVEKTEFKQSSPVKERMSPVRNSSPTRNYTAAASSFPAGTLSRDQEALAMEFMKTREYQQWLASRTQKSSVAEPQLSGRHPNLYEAAQRESPSKLDEQYPELKRSTIPVNEDAGGRLNITTAQSLYGFSRDTAQINRNSSMEMEYQQRAATG